MKREETLARIRENPEVSVLIIGGGINGLGTFRDLALQVSRPGLAGSGRLVGRAGRLLLRSQCSFFTHGSWRYPLSGKW